MNLTQPDGTGTLIHSFDNSTLDQSCQRCYKTDNNDLISICNCDKYIYHRCCLPYHDQTMHVSCNKCKVKYKTYIAEYRIFSHNFHIGLNILLQILIMRFNFDPSNETKLSGLEYMSNVILFSTTLILFFVVSLIIKLARNENINVFILKYQYTITIGLFFGKIIGGLLFRWKYGIWIFTPYSLSIGICIVSSLILIFNHISIGLTKLNPESVINVAVY